MFLKCRKGTSCNYDELNSSTSEKGTERQKSEDTKRLISVNYTSVAFVYYVLLYLYSYYMNQILRLNLRKLRVSSAVEDFVFGGDLGGGAGGGTDDAGAHAYADGIGEADTGAGFADRDVVEADVGDGFLCRSLKDECSGGGFVAGESGNVDVGHGRVVGAFKTLPGIAARDVEKVLDLTELAIFHEDSGDESAAVRIGLDVETAFAVTGIIAVLDDDVAHTSRHLAADDHCMEALEMAVADDDVLTRHVGCPSVVVAAALYGYVVVAVVEVDVLYEDVARRFGIDTVVVDEFRIIAEAAADGILALQEVDAPEWRVDDFHAFERHTLAAVEL